MVMGHNHKGSDIEYGYGYNNNHNNVNNQEGLYPSMVENAELRWAFIRKVYVIVSMQLILTAAIAASVVYYRPIPRFITETRAGLVIYIAVILSTFLLMIPLYFFHKRHPWNYFLLTLFTLAISFSGGLTCAHFKGIVILETAIICTVVVVSLTLYTFWAVKRGADFQFIGPFLFACLLVLITFALIQLVFPLGKPGVTIYAAFSSLLFCGFIIYDTDTMIKRYNYDEYIWAAVALYLDVVNLFQSLLILLGAVSD